MNVTETFECVFALAMEGARTGLDPKQRKALLAFGVRVRMMRRALDDGRRRRAEQKLRTERFLHLRDELQRLGQCHACGWQHACGIERHTGHLASVSPLATCTGEFGCSLECLRYKSSEWHPDLLKPKAPK